MKLLSPKMIMVPIICKKSYNYLQWQCDWKHSNTLVMMSLFFFGLKICTNVKSKYEKGIFDHFFYEKKVIKFAKDWKSCCDISLLVLVWQQF
jgi:hypothetical protein